VLLENNQQEQLIFKHAISTVVSGRPGAFEAARPDTKSVPMTEMASAGMAHR
jgi:host factor-I protein